MVDGLFFCATFTSHRGGHTPFVQSGTGTSDTGAEAVKPDPGSTLEGHSGGGMPGSGMKMRRRMELSVNSTFHYSIGDPSTVPHPCCYQMNL